MDYGLWPFDTLTSWTADEAASLAAEVGLSAGPEVYDELDTRMTETPADVNVAHEQAVYFLALAARRADYENEKAAQDLLVHGKRLIEAQQNQLDSGWMCAMTGYGCTGSGSAEVLRQAADIIQKSGLNTVDTDKIVGHLTSNRRGVQLRQAAPFLALAAAGGAWWWWRSTR